MNIFITGASSGLGLCLVKEFLSHGNEVCGIGRREFSYESLNADLRQRFTYYQCDISKEDQVRDTFQNLANVDYVPDIVVFCAGSATDDNTEGRFCLNRYKENFRINLFGGLCWLELFLPCFLKRNRGVFAGISSMSVYRENHINRIGYSASRCAMNKTFENLRLEYLGTGVEFTTFTLGRLQERSGFIGISYAKAACVIVKMLSNGKYSKKVDIPFVQYLLTRMAQLIPDWLFKKFLMSK
ncbi:MAG: SDR family NAD(P)-dependent oxidoreductase [Deltaproteobacteria bacterium]|nr:SDR family NAD(P)-dependent oxidoreductase [Deltaproteobacteria bacterium]